MIVKYFIATLLAFFFGFWGASVGVEDAGILEPASRIDVVLGVVPQLGQLVHVGNTTGAAQWLGHPSGDHLFSFTVETAGDYRISLCHQGTEFDTCLGLYRDVGCTDQLAWNDDFDDSRSRLDVTLDHGTYWVHVEGYDTAEGPYQLHVTHLRVPVKTRLVLEGDQDCLEPGDLYRLHILLNEATTTVTSGRISLGYDSSRLELVDLDTGDSPFAVQVLETTGAGAIEISLNSDRGRIADALLTTLGFVALEPLCPDEDLVYFKGGLSASQLENRLGLALNPELVGVKGRDGITISPDQHDVIKTSGGALPADSTSLAPSDKSSLVVQPAAQGGDTDWGSRAPCSGDFDIDGSGTATWNYPLSTYYHDARTTSIYLASEFGCDGGDINAMKYYVSSYSTQTMYTFTIRMRHTALSSYSSGTFENTGWTTVYQSNVTLSAAGWYTFTFSTPFTWNGTSNLEVDVCFNNSTYTSDSTVYYYTSGSGSRSKYYRCDSCTCGTTDPLTWSCSGSLTTNVPRAIFSMTAGARPCSSCTPEDAALGTIGTTVYGYNVSGNCGNGGKWVGSFNGESGAVYHFDVCPDAPGSGSNSGFDPDIKICDASCTILAGQDGSCSSPSYSPNDYQWTCPSNGTYYVIFAPYYSYTSHTCTGSAANTFTMYYYKEAAGLANDNCAGATAIGDVTNLAFDTTTATFDGPGGCMTTPNIWYCYTASCTGTALFSLCGSSFDTKLAVYDGCTCWGTQLACNDDSGPGCAGLQSSIEYPVKAGNQYLIEVGGYSGTGSGVLSVNCTPNDACANAAAIGNVTNLPYETTSATFDGPGTCQYAANIWYCYTAPGCGSALISLCGSSYDTKLAVYDGCACWGTQLACNDDNGPGCSGLQSSIQIPVSSGGQYLIEVGGYSSNTGDGVLSTSFTADASAPTLTIPGSATIQCHESSDPSNTGQATALDDIDPSPTVSYSDVPNLTGCNGTGTITRSWWATDDCGNTSATQNQIITVQDTTVPSLNLPPNITIECTASQDPTNTGQATATDNCDPAPVVGYSDSAAAGSCPQELVITRTWTATDACSNVASLDQIITVDDSTAPQFSTTPPNVTIECKTSLDPADTGGLAAATDNCGTATIDYADNILTTTCYPVSANYHSGSTDAAAKTQASLIRGYDTEDGWVKFDTSAIPDGSHIISIEFNFYVNSTYYPYWSITPVSVDPVTASAADLYFDINAETTVGYYNYQNESSSYPTGWHVLTMGGTAGPDLRAGLAGDAFAIGVASRDNSPTYFIIIDGWSEANRPYIVVRHIASGTCGEEAVVSRTWTATDECGNAVQHVQTITIDDSTAPTITQFPVDQGYQCLGEVPAIDTGLVAATDNCGAVTITHQGDSTSGMGCAGNPYIVTRTYRAADSCGNAVDQNQTFTVTDTTNPVISGCPGNITVNAEAGGCTAVVNWTAPTAADNCTLASFVSTHNPGATFSGVTAVTYTATDACGNSDICSFDVTVEPVNEVLVDLELFGGYEPGPFTRCITFELHDCGGSNSHTMEQVLSFSGGAASATLLVPCGLYNCISARDGLHSLRRVINTLPIAAGKYDADFTTVASEDLIHGNLMADDWIDIIDYGIFAANYGANYGTGSTTCATASPHADISGNGIVGTEDFTHIQTNFLMASETPCCGTPVPLPPPVTSITLGELVKRGLGELAVADLNHDGVLDQLDMTAFMQGEKPRVKTDRNSTNSRSQETKK